MTRIECFQLRRETRNALTSTILSPTEAEVLMCLYTALEDGARLVTPAKRVIECCTVPKQQVFNGMQRLFELQYATNISHGKYRLTAKGLEIAEAMDNDLPHNKAS